MADMIEIKDLNKYFGDVHVLKDINLSVAAGEKLVVIGPSGSGKSTLIRCIDYLEEPGRSIECETGSYRLRSALRKDRETITKQATGITDGL